MGGHRCLPRRFGLPTLGGGRRPGPLAGFAGPETGQGVESKLGNEKFLARAGEDVVDSEKARLEELRVEQRTLEANQEAFLRNLGSAPGT